MKQSASISIVVPVYKIQERYLRECIDSLINQTYNDIEIIFIDDGSPDNCGQICDEYAERDFRIKVIHQENQGVSAARNAGIALATGKWLMFVDADDWLELDACEKLVAAAEELNVEILYFCSYKNWINQSAPIRYPFKNKEKLDKKQIYIEILAPKTLNGLGTACGKVYLLKAFKECNIRFSYEQALGEDSLLQMKLTKNMDRMAYMDDCLYHYRVRRSSATMKYREDRDDQNNNLVNQFYNFLTENQIEDNDIWQAFYMRVCTAGQEIVRAQYFHPENRIPYAKRKQLCDDVFNRPIFKQALQNIECNALSLKQKLKIYMLRKRLYFPLVCLVKLYNRKKDLYE